MITFDIDQALVPKEYRLSKTDLLRFGKAIATAPRAVPGIMSLAFVSDERIQALNRMYRHKDKVTDVLSFGYELTPGTLLGDIAISYDQAVRQAEGGDIELELADLIVHGALHVLGYDHEDPKDAAEMFPLQDKIVASLL